MRFFFWGFSLEDFFLYASFVFFTAGAATCFPLVLTAWAAMFFDSKT